MPNAIEMGLQPHDLEQVVGSVFSTMMGIEVESVAAAAEPIPTSAMAAAVRFGGSWNGIVLVQCLPRQACEFAGWFLGMPAPPVVDADVRDVLGEVANMIAGNLKCTLRPGIRLSVPVVTDAAGAGETPAVQVYCAGFMTPQGPFWLRVIRDSPV
jgi:chemotaxis protein CheX